MSKRSRAAALAGAMIIATTSVGGVLASSHREAPLIANDPAADNTDLYAFLNPSDPTKLTIIANYVPLEEPAGGPNFFPFDPAVRYEIKIDNNGDGKSDITYRFKFKTRTQAKNFAGIPTYPVQRRSGHDPQRREPARQADLQRRAQRRRDRRRPADARRPTSARDRPRTTLRTAAQAVHSLKYGTKVFAGQRDDAFFVDLGSIFDLGRACGPSTARTLDPQAARRPESMASAGSTRTRSRSMSPSST